jgi:hypothetical protein
MSFNNHTGWLWSATQLEEASIIESFGSESLPCSINVKCFVSLLSPEEKLALPVPALNNSSILYV